MENSAWLTINSQQQKICSQPHKPICCRIWWETSSDDQFSCSQIQNCATLRRRWLNRNTRTGIKVFLSPNESVWCQGRIDLPKNQCHISPRGTAGPLWRRNTGVILGQADRHLTVKRAKSSLGLNLASYKEQKFPCDSAQNRRGQTCLWTTAFTCVKVKNGSFYVHVPQV